MLYLHLFAENIKLEKQIKIKRCCLLDFQTLNTANKSLYLLLVNTTVIFVHVFRKTKKETPRNAD